jgi:hypothetical protein
MAERFELDTQQKRQWCWAAVSAGVHGYFSGQAALSQCDVAQRLLGKNCCQDPDACDSPQRLEAALEAIGAKVHVQPGRLDFQHLKAEIDAGRPVCARIGWFDGGGHFVVLYGYRESKSGGRQVLVSDPLFPDSIVEYDEFVSAYQAGGHWTGSYLLQPPEER